MLLAFLKMNIVLLLLSLVYYLGLRKLTFHRLNRWYFLLTIGFTLAYPFIDLSSLFNAEQQQVLSRYSPSLSYNSGDTGYSQIFRVVIVLLLAGSSIMFIRLLRQLGSLLIIHRRSVPGRMHNISVQMVTDQLNPFSFGRRIYINPSLHSPQQQEAILAHENIHVQQWHTLDVLLAELMLVINWFNPAAWWLSRSIRENLEFITDHAILQEGFDRKQYQYSLLQVSIASSGISIANEFTLRDIKRRIQMMNGRPSSRLHLFRYGLFPLLLIIFSLFAVTARVNTVRQAPATTERSGSVAADDAKNNNGSKNQAQESEKPAEEIVVVGRRSLQRDGQLLQPEPGEANSSTTPSNSPGQEPIIVTGYPSKPRSGQQ